MQTISYCDQIRLKHDRLTVQTSSICLEVKDKNTHETAQNNFNILIFKYVLFMWPIIEMQPLMVELMI